MDRPDPPPRAPGRPPENEFAIEGGPGGRIDGGADGGGVGDPGFLPKSGPALAPLEPLGVEATDPPTPGGGGGGAPSTIPVLRRSAMVPARALGGVIRPGMSPPTSDLVGVAEGDLGAPGGGGGGGDKPLEFPMI